jgi:hypothetical protein
VPEQQEEKKKKLYENEGKSNLLAVFFLFSFLRRSYLFTPMSFAGLESNAMIELPLPY